MTTTPFDKKATGIVIESYNHDETHLIVVVRNRVGKKEHYFFYIHSAPRVEIGDLVQMDFPKEKIFVVHNIATRPFMRFPIRPLVWPGTLLMEVMSERADL